MNLSKTLKQKRDAEARLKSQSPNAIYFESSTGEQYIDLSKLAAKDHTHAIVDLTDVDITYTDNAGKILKVNDTEDGVDLGDRANIVTSLPTASEEYRGQIYTLDGGTGVADIAYICLKDNTDTYNWVAI